MKKHILRIPLIVLFAITAACGPKPAVPTATASIPVVPTETPGPMLRFVTPQDGASLDYEAMNFQVEPVAGADGYTWTLIQNGKTLWDTFGDEKRLYDTEYDIPFSGTLNGVITQGELQVQVKARVNGVWTKPAAITVHLPERKPTSSPTPVPTQTLPPPASGEVEIRWFVGLGAGSSPNQQSIERYVVNKFNQSHPNIKLTLQIVDNGQAAAALAGQFGEGKGPDLVGPMGWHGSSSFPGQWFDLSALIADTGFDTSIYRPELMDMYKTGDGQVGLPYTVYPAAIFYNTSLFDAARLDYPPDGYGKTYHLPDGPETEWNWETLAEVARRLTLDASGRNANDPAFDATHIVQYGFTPLYQKPTAFASYWEASQLYDDHRNAVIPPAWKTAWEWYYDGMWGKKPFILNQKSANTSHFGYGCVFCSAYVAMGIGNSWNIGPNMSGGQHWDLGALPAFNGVVHGRIDSDTFRIWKGTPHPREAFEVLTYLQSPAAANLLDVYGGIPARTADQEAFFKARGEQFPFVRNWEVLKAGLNYPDIPSAEGYMPNFTDGWNRLNAFGDLLASNETISVEAEIDALRRDLDAIFKRP
jgi:multiple sugar transport system substrate-binding protein